MLDMRMISQYLPDFFEALLETLKVAALSGAFSLIIGTVVGILSTMKSRFARIPVGIYTGFIRSTPLLVQLYFVHYGLPITGLMLTSFQSAIVAFSLNSGAYISEIVRGGLIAIDKGQAEASKALGLSWFQTMRKVILPQVFRNILPPLISQFSYLIKDTSLAAVLVIPELTYTARKIAARTYMPFESFGVPMLMYFGIYLVLALLSGLISRNQKSRQSDAKRWFGLKKVV
ncbi:amino acid ABC transporter permease [Mesotoga sp. H07pep.5.4]|uniref:amino acid ABC transporter permease n=1 Tax=Mesotoga sp. H07pep.5.4 TaxID=1463664 RepID=UPI000EF15C8B|nr:amino acid ABC transporter permease [Mesotoga sp. H07pep.5.4]RLL82093.1 polar amino acid ABC transporter permease [Mesotoga sp. H07pep.5.4]